MAEEKVGFFKRLVNGLTKTRDSIVAGIDSIFSGYSNIDDDFYEEIEEILAECERATPPQEELEYDGQHFSLRRNHDEDSELE